MFLLMFLRHFSQRLHKNLLDEKSTLFAYLQTGDS
jgi:hypothetical protein